MKRGHLGPAIAGLLVMIFLATSACWPQQQSTFNKDEKDQVSDMLRDGYNDVKKNYYDPKLKGLDWDARYKKYDAMIGSAHNLGDGFRIVAAFLSGLQDSHTFFMPPGRATRYDYGYHYALVGNDCFITQVRPGSDAASKLHIGDQIMYLNGYTVNRDDYHDVWYFFNILSPQMKAQVDLRNPAGEQRRVVVDSLVKTDRKLMDLTNPEDYFELVRRGQNNYETERSRMIENGDAAIWKLQQFNINYGEIDKNIGIARKHKTLILDLRGNPGGYIETLKWIVGSLFDHDIKIDDQVARKETKPMIAKHDGHPFTGKLIVLIDSGSASCSELLARVVQLEHRGIVIGDRSAGAVMESWGYGESQGADTRIFYGFSVTVANLIMTDGKSLEKAGVQPDEVLLPTGADLAVERDPVLVHAADLAGVQLTPEAAGKLFPFKWPPL